MVIGKPIDMMGRLVYEEKLIERVQHYKYLGWVRAKIGKPHEIDRTAFVKIKAALRIRDINHSLRIRIQYILKDLPNRNIRNLIPLVPVAGKSSSNAYLEI